MKAIKFTREELRWIERTADLESAIAMNRFTSLINQTNIKKLNKKEKRMCQDTAEELTNLYIFLKSLRIKLELWDCRYDVEKGFKINDALHEDSEVKDGR